MSLFGKREKGPEELREVASPPAAPRASSPQAPKLEPRKERSAMANIGKSIHIKGDVIGDEDLVIEGRVEGRVELKNHHLTVGPNGDVSGEVAAKQVTLVGKVTGNIHATERAEISDTGRLDGDLTSPRLLVKEGAQLNGNITMKSTPATAGASKPQPVAAPIGPVGQQKAG
jgi:cytoskeletal protein CcmA (bactofilin family)